MKKILIYKLIISLLFFGLCNTKISAKETTFATLVPSITEIIYSLGAENQLVAVSTECDYPKDAQKKEKIGNTYFFNKEKLLQLNPDYLLTVEGAQFANFHMPKNTIKAICYTMNSVNAVYEAILSIGKLAGKEEKAFQIVKELSFEIDNIKPEKQQRILYLVQIEPLITIGNKSYLSDVIRKSGQTNVTDNLSEFYPAVSFEYIVSTKPDIIVISFKKGFEKIQKLFPDTKIVFLTEEENSFINRPGPRINKAVRFFADL